MIDYGDFSTVMPNCYFILKPDHVANDEDSSYDSDNELAHDSPHQNVSRTTSDTLGQEFAEYYSNSVI